MEPQAEPLPASTTRALELVVQYLDVDLNGTLSTADVVAGFQRL